MMSIKLSYYKLLIPFVFFESLFPILFYLTNSSIFLYLPLLFTVFNIIILNYLIKLKLNYILYIGLVFLFLVLFLILNRYPFEISYFSGLVLFLWNITLAILLVNISFSKALIGFIFFSFSFFVLFLGGVNGFDPDFGNHIFLESSRNYVSAVCIIYYICYVGLAIYHKTKVNILFSVLLVIVCIALFGRSGIALSIILFMHAVFYNYGIKYLFLISFLVLALIGPIIYFAINYTNFSDGLETPRDLMRYEYLNNMSSFDILFGRNFYQCCQTIVAFGPNPHNSFIALHSLFGLFGVVLSLFPIFISLCTKKFQLAFLILVIYVRYFYDVLGLFYILDFGLFVIFMICLKKEKVRGD